MKTKTKPPTLTERVRAIVAPPIRGWFALVSPEALEEINQIIDDYYAGKYPRLNSVLLAKAIQEHYSLPVVPRTICSYISSRKKAE